MKTTQTASGENTKDGIYEDFPLPWTCLVKLLGSDKETIDLLDALFEQCPLEGTVEIRGGKPVVDISKKERMDLLRRWLEMGIRNKFVVKKKAIHAMGIIYDRIFPYVPPKKNS